MYVLGGAIGIFGLYRIYLGRYVSGVILTGAYIFGHILCIYPTMNTTEFNWIFIVAGIIVIFTCFCYWLIDGIKLFGMKKGSL